MGCGLRHIQIKDSHTSEGEVGEEGKEPQVTENPASKPHAIQKAKDKGKIKAKGFGSGIGLLKKPQATEGTESMEREVEETVEMNTSSTCGRHQINLQHAKAASASLCKGFDKKGIYIALYDRKLGYTGETLRATDHNKVKYYSVDRLKAKE